MDDLKLDCPWCSIPLGITNTTHPRAQRVGLVYLSARCGQCKTKIEAAAKGQDAATSSLVEQVERRKGTDPERWKINPRPQRKRRSRR